MIRCLGSQPRHDPREHSHVTPPFPAVVERLVRAILFGCITPAQPITIDEYNATQNTPVVDAWHPYGTLENTVGAASVLRSASKDCS